MPTQRTIVEADLQVRLAGHSLCSAGDMPIKLSPRLKTFDYLGYHRYFVTICTDCRKRSFLEREPVETVVSTLSRTATDEHFSIVAYCLMPDHIHVLAEGCHPAAEFKEFIRIFKQRTSYQWKQRVRQTLWQRGYFEHVLRAEEDTIGVTRYILENPVRAGLVTRPEDYPYLGSMTMTVRDLLYSVQI